jgi:hypothetical protein
MLSRHLGRALTEQQRARWVRLMGEAADEAGLPADPEFRAAFVSYLEWGSRTAAASPRSNAQAIEARSRSVNNGRMSRSKLAEPVTAVAGGCSAAGCCVGPCGGGAEPSVEGGGPAVPQSQWGTGMRSGGCAPGWLSGWPCSAGGWRAASSISLP